MTKQVIQLILIMLVGTDICVPVVFVWEETGVPGGNPPVRLGDHVIVDVGRICEMLVQVGATPV